MKSSSATVSATLARRACALAACGAAPAAWAGYEVPNPAYAPPTAYYNTATGTGFTLRTNLHNIVTTGFKARTYGDSRYAMGTGDIGGSPATGAGEDLDPNNPANILLAYNRGSVSAKWDGNSSTIIWNREHVWPKYWLNVTSSQVSNTYSGPASDAFELRPADANVNSGRGDLWYGYYPNTGGNGSPPPKSVDVSTVTNYGGNSGGGVNYWYPGSQDIGDVARTLFYMATRYFDPTDTSRTNLSINNLELVNGPPPTDTGSGVPRYKMGDLNSLLHWNYQDGVDNFERRRNQLIYGSSGDLTNHALNPSYYQGNRNPFIDHPEYVWAVFGGGNNNSQIRVGSAPANPDGSSSTTVDLGRAIVGATLPTGSFALNKSGANPTTFDVAASGVAATAASALQVGTGQPFDYNAGSRTMTLQLTASTATVGIKTGTVTVDNTDLTTGGAGLGSADGNDTVNVTATVVDHSTGSLAAGSTVTSQTLDFGYVPQGFADRTASFAIANRPAASGFTADLALNSISPSGSASFATDAAPFAHLAAGAQNAYTATLATATAGTLSATHTFNVGDEAIPGATAGPSLGLTMTARVLSSATFPVTGFIRLNAGETYDTGPFSVAAGVTLTKSGPGAMNVTGPQSNGAGSALAVTGGAVTLATDAGSAFSVSTANAGTTLAFSSAQHLASLAVGDNTTATVTAGGGNLLVTRSLTVGPLGTLDLNDNDAIVTADPDAIRASLFAARAGGAWSGTGITSTAAAADPRHAAALAYAPASLLGPTFDGEALDPASVALKYTYYGDANLDGAITADDYALLDKGFATSASTWIFGDFNYDGVVDQNDYLLIDTSLGLEQSGTLSPALLADREARFGDAYVTALLAAVPEPTSLGIVGIALLLTARRTRRA